MATANFVKKLKEHQLMDRVLLITPTMVQMASQATWPPELLADSPEIQESGNPEICKFGIQQIQHIKVSE